jgi:hypothetical protein
VSNYVYVENTIEILDFYGKHMQQRTFGERALVIGALLVKVRRPDYVEIRPLKARPLQR